MKLALVAVVGMLVACGPAASTGSPHDGSVVVPPDAAQPYLELSPANATLTVENGAIATQAYTVALVALDGSKTDVTAQATFAVVNPAFGAFAAATLTASGGAAGMTQVHAMVGSAVGAAPLTVILKATRVEGNAPPGAGSLFGSATPGTGPAPAIVYPADGVIAPPNVGAFDIHWTTTTANLFAVELTNAYADITIYTTGLAGGNWWTALLPAEWNALATTQVPLAITVSGIDTAAPATKTTSAPVHVRAANEPLVGGMYYWSTNTAGGNTPGDVFRYDMSKPDVAPVAYYAPAQIPGGYCVGCHVLSHDGTRLAFDIGMPGGSSTVVKVADQSLLIPYDTNPVGWGFATFNGDGTKLVTIGNDNQLVLRSAAGGAVLAPIPSTPNMTPDHPEVSPDGTMLVNVEEPTSQSFLTPITGSLVVRSFDDTSLAFGPIKTVLADGVGGLSSFYPSWSPDGQWLLTTRVDGSTNEGAYNNPLSTVWVVKADGTAPPIALAAANATGPLGNSWARWAPFPETIGAAGEPLYFLTFTSRRPYGVRAAGVEQIWMSTFSPTKAAAGMDPSTPAFRLPFQALSTGNHIAQWTQQFVPIIE